MEEMNMLEMAENTTLEVPAVGTETEKSGGSVLATVVAAGGVIALWEGAKWLGKRAYNGIKKVFKKKSEEATEGVEVEAVEAEVID